ncbi:hypothetical protein VMT65_31150 [Nocardia sp. CDC153]|uniref:hypothetical protein n=1 Tax=Nocardia sp. CDC153 TaxID=3112167 RepID=UPI002DBBD87C|nr:hypothetical protein [Nocardia sp. CDC153]MEC3957527.1 hypothetical protein [Nocardia sp. CDC153]
MNHPEYHGYTVGTYRPSPAYDAESALYGKEFNASGLVLRTGLIVPPEYRLKVFILLLTFATGLYAGVLLFDRPSHETATVVVCPGPGSAPVAVLPAECGTQEAGR